MPVKVSVVVAVYNPGRHIDGLIRSLDAQSLPPHELEVIFVDDGSTDGTLERLEQVTTTRPHFQVTSIPNSGWPGRPRNVGTALAAGDYVFYADNDDEIFPEALERMHAMALENASDIVYGKVVRTGRDTPYWPLAKRNIAVADPLRDDILSSRTVHKLFRRDFLTKNSIRFPEGRVRLEDHNFMAQALSVAQVISVVADYPCYLWKDRTDGSNGSETRIDYDRYWGYFAEALQIFQQVAGPGELTDAALLAGVSRMFYTVRPSKYLRRDDAARARMFDPLHRLVTEEVPGRLDERISVLKRGRLHALRAGDRERFDRLQEVRGRLRFPVRLDSAAWQDGRLHLRVTASLTTRRGALLALERSGDDLLLPASLVPGLPAELRRLLPEDRGDVELTLRNRVSGVEWPLAGTQRTELVETGSGLGLVATHHAVMDPADNGFGSPLEDGVWDVLARVQFLGEPLVQRVPVSKAVRLPCEPVATGERDALASRTATDGLAVRVPNSWRQSRMDSSPGVVRADWRGSTLRLTLDLPDGVAASRLSVRRRDDGSGRDVRIEQGSASVRLGRTARGDVLDFYVDGGATGSPVQERRLRFAAADVVQRPPYRIFATGHGGFSVKHQDRRSSALAIRARQIAATVVRRASGRGARAGG